MVQPRPSGFGFGLSTHFPFACRHQRFRDSLTPYTVSRVLRVTPPLLFRSPSCAETPPLASLHVCILHGIAVTQCHHPLPPDIPLPMPLLQLAILRWNSRSCLLARYYRGDAGMAGCRDSPVQFDLVFGEFSDWPYYPDQLMTVYRCGLRCQGCPCVSA